MKVSKKRPTKRRVREAKCAPRTMFPPHLETTPAEWRGLKRTEWQEVVHAIERYQYGSAFTPEQPAFYKLQRLSRQVSEALAVEDWIAW